MDYDDTMRMLAEDAAYLAACITGQASAHHTYEVAETADAMRALRESQTPALSEGIPWDDIAGVCLAAMRGASRGF